MRMNAHAALLVVACLLVPSLTRAQTELRNDGSVDGAAVGFQAGFDAGEIGASSFTAPAASTLQRVRFLFGGAATQQTITLRVYDDTAGGVAPGAELFSGDFQLTGSNTAMQEIDLTGMSVNVPARFRVGIQFQHMGLPAIARDDDGTVTPGVNFIFASQLSAWVRVGPPLFDVPGDWIIRAVISSGGGGTPDAGVPLPDADPTAPDGGGGGGGGACTGNGDCTVGEYCDLDRGSCTFDCRMATDCGGDQTCNSLGQCVAGADGDGGGCGCTSSSSGASAAGTFALLGLLGLATRGRRPRRRAAR